MPVIVVTARELLETDYARLNGIGAADRPEGRRYSAARRGRCSAVLEAEKSGRSGGDLLMAKILVVEDSPDIRALIRMLLEAAGHEVVTRRRRPVGRRGGPAKSAPISS